MRRSTQLLNTGGKTGGNGSLWHRPVHVRDVVDTPGERHRADLGGVVSQTYANESLRRSATREFRFGALAFAFIASPERQ